MFQPKSKIPGKENEDRRAKMPTTLDGWQLLAIALPDFLYTVDRYCLFLAPFDIICIFTKNGVSWPEHTHAF